MYILYIIFFFYDLLIWSTYLKKWNKNRAKDGIRNKLKKRNFSFQEIVSDTCVLHIFVGAN